MVAHVGSFHRGGDRHPAPVPGDPPRSSTSPSAPRARTATSTRAAQDGRRRFFVVPLKEHKLATREEFDKDRDTYMQTLLRARQNEALAHLHEAPPRRVKARHQARRVVHGGVDARRRRVDRRRRALRQHGAARPRRPLFEVREHPRGGARRRRAAAASPPRPPRPLRAHGLALREPRRRAASATSSSTCSTAGRARSRTAHDVNFAFERLGGSLYAATQVDYGRLLGVLAAGEPRRRRTGALRRRARSSPTFPDVDIEKGIVCEEILEDLDDEGRQVDADNVSRALIYPSHPLGLHHHGRRGAREALRRQGCCARTTRSTTAARTCVVVGSRARWSPSARHRRGRARARRIPGGRRASGRPPPHAQKKPRLRLVESVSSQTELRVCFRAFSESRPQPPGRSTCSCARSTTACRRGSTTASATRRASATT